MCVEIPVKASQASKSILKRALSIFSQLYTQKKYARVSSYHAKQIKILGLSLIVEYFQMGYYKLKLYCDVKCNYYNININITMKEKEQTSLQNQIISLKRDSLLDMPDRNTRKYLEKVIEIVDELYNSRLEYQTEQNQQIKQINDRISREQNQKKQNQIKDSQRLSKNKQITFQKLSNYLKTTICIAFTVVIGLLIISVIFYQQLDKTDQIPSLLKKMEETEQRVSDQIKKLEREYQEKIQNLQILIFNVRNLNKAQIKQFQMKEGLLKQSILKIAKENNRNKVKQDKIEKVVSTWNDLKKLEKLSLNNSMISQLPQSFFYLKNLKQLNLRGNKLANISHSFEDLKELQVLQIDQNLLTELPKALGHMTKMKRLSASENKLSNLPESFMYLTNLIILNISDNLFSTFPQILAHLSKLEQLFICNNNISMLPQSLLNLTKIKKLYASKNSLQNLPQNLTNLKELQQLSLRRNKLIKLPQSLGNLKELKTLYLQINQLTQLPQSLGNLSKLQTLYIYYNPNLKELPKSFKNLKELKVLYIDWQLLPKQNIFQTEPFASLKNLKKLWIVMANKGVQQQGKSANTTKYKRIFDECSE